MFAEHIGKTMEVYVDNMIVNNRKENQHVAEMTKVFNFLNAYKMKLILPNVPSWSIQGSFGFHGKPKRNRG